MFGAAGLSELRYLSLQAVSFAVFQKSNQVGGGSIRDFSISSLLLLNYVLFSFQADKTNLVYKVS